MTLRSLVRSTIVACVLLSPLVLTRIPMTRAGAAAPASRSAVAPALEAAPRPAVRVLPAAAQGSLKPRRQRPAFGFRVTDRGGRQLYVSGADLQFANTRYPDGRTIIVLAADNDRVEIGVSSRDGVSITRGGRTVSFFHGDVTEEALDQARAALAGSKAVRRFRMLAADDDDDDLKHPGVTGLQISDAIVGLLDGDVGAPMRLARRIKARQSTASQVRRVTTATEEEAGCWSSYVGEVARAAGDYESCANSFAIWNPLSAFCAFEWIIHIEGAWAQYLVCVGVPELLKE